MHTRSSRPRVSVVVPMHNSLRHLRQALDSVLAQRHGDWEAFLVDDASTDATLALARSYAERDPRFHVIALRENIGVAQARNVAIAASSGELVALLDHDDAWREDYLQTCVELFDAACAAGRRVGIVASNALILGGEGPAGETFADRFGWADPIDYDRMIERNCICARATFARHAYDDVGPFSVHCPAYDDYDMWLRIIEAGYEVVVTREPIAIYRDHPGAMSRDRLTMAEGALATHTRALARGNLTPRRERALRARVRHDRALRERERLHRAVEQRRPLASIAALARAIPSGGVAVLQSPERWGEWSAQLVRRARPRSTSS